MSKFTITVSDLDMEKRVYQVIEEKQSKLRERGNQLNTVWGLTQDRNATRKAAVACFMNGDLEQAVKHVNTVNALEVQIAKVKGEQFTQRLMNSMATMCGAPLKAQASPITREQEAAMVDCPPMPEVPGWSKIDTSVAQ